MQTTITKPPRDMPYWCVEQFTRIAESIRMINRLQYLNMALTASLIGVVLGVKLF
jgi:hypothetical protein